MNTWQLVAALIAIVGGVVFVAGVATLIAITQRRPSSAEIAPIKRSPAGGVLYAFTMGMNPFVKESARLHWVAYLRGVIFHASIFLAVIFLITSPWIAYIPLSWRIALSVLFSIGALLTLAGIGMRLLDSKLRFMSVPDDYFAIAIVTLFLAFAAVVAIIPGLMPAFWIISGVILAYAPFGKLRHFLYFFYERILLGLLNGRRGNWELRHE